MIGVFALFLIIDAIFFIDYDAFWDWGNVLRPASMLLMIVAMVLSIRHVNRYGEN